MSDTKTHPSTVASGGCAACRSESRASLIGRFAGINLGRRASSSQSGFSDKVIAKPPRSTSLPSIIAANLGQGSPLAPRSSLENSARKCCNCDTRSWPRTIFSLSFSFLKSSIFYSFARAALYLLRLWMRRLPCFSRSPRKIRVLRNAWMRLQCRTSVLSPFVPRQVSSTELWLCRENLFNDSQERPKIHRVIFLQFISWNFGCKPILSVSFVCICAVLPDSPTEIWQRLKIHSASFFGTAE